MAGEVAKKAAEKVPSWIERILVPSLNELKGEIKAVNARIDSLDDRMNTRITALDGKIDSLRNETKIEMEGLRKEMQYRFEVVDSKFETINTKLDSLEKRIPVIEEITALKIRMADLEKRLAVA